MTIKKLLSVYLVALLLAACESGGDDPQPTTGNISGIISAARGQSPIADAEVTVGSSVVRSAMDGSFELSNLPTGMAVIRAEASGFEPYSASIQIQQGQNNHNVQMERPSIYEMDPFTMYLSPEIEEVKGVLIYFTATGDSRPWIRGDVAVGFEALQDRELAVALADTYGLAFIGNDNTLYQDAFPNETVLSALEDFSIASDHQELAHAPLLTFGYSNGGRAAVDFAFDYPERTVGAYAYKGVIYNFSDQDWESIRNIPVFLHIGEFDDTAVGSLEPGAIPEQFATNREQGALWAAGIEKGVAHEFDPPMEFMSIWMEELINSRIPDQITPGTIPVLNVITEESGWAGDLDTFEVKPYMDFQGDPGSASWLPNEKTAQDWRLFFQ